MSAAEVEDLRRLVEALTQDVNRLQAENSALLMALDETVCIGCETRIGGPARDMSRVFGMAGCPICKTARAAIAKARGA